MALLAAVGEAAAALAAAWIAHAAAKAVGEGNALKPRHGRTHRYAGMATLVWLGLGGVGADARIPAAAVFAYDAVLAALAIATTVSAAETFGRARKAERVRNDASGPLDDDATVTQEEMYEHAFFQVINLTQIAWLHAAPLLVHRWWRAAALALATAPWLFRSRVPHHSFRANYVDKPFTWTRLFYRVKKWQFVAYKHVFLHGLNATVCAFPELDGVARTPAFRRFWVLLNASYVLEFFLQTLVRAKFMRQAHMLVLNALLQVSASCFALPVALAFVSPHASVLSLALNFAQVGNEPARVLLAALLAASAPRPFA